MFFVPMYTQNRITPLSWKRAANMKTFTLKILHKLATVIAALLLYGVIVMLQAPKHPHGAANAESASRPAAQASVARGASTLR